MSVHGSSPTADELRNNLAICNDAVGGIALALMKEGGVLWNGELDLGSDP